MMADPVAPEVVASALGRVVQRIDLNHATFAESVPARLLLKPISPGYGPTEEQFQALEIAAAEEGDREAFISTWLPPEHGDNAILRPLTWENYHTYHPGAWPIMPHLIYSPRGAWGLWVTLDIWALVAGSTAFVDRFAGQLSTTADAMARLWLEDFAAYHRRWPDDDVTWVHPLLVHLYGQERADALVAASAFGGADD